MPTTEYHGWLTELTSLPTAAGREQRVIEWIGAWSKRRRWIKLSADRYGNLSLTRRAAGRRRAAKPIVFQAHLDHPAFVVRQVLDDRRVIADFRGGVRDDYFKGAAVRWHGEGGAAARGVVEELRPASPDKRAVIRFNRRTAAARGDVITWALPAARIAGDRLRAPACDDLAAVAAALAAFDELHRERSRADARLLFTRAEEVGFIGAIGAARAKTVPKNAIIVALENSKSFADSPIGAGPIVRVGDRISTFNPQLTYQLDQIARQLAAKDKSFRHQRKLMPGGACEATAWQAYGYTASCICLPLGNYHNMNEDKKKIDREFISVSDFDNLVKLLVAVGDGLGGSDDARLLTKRLDAMFKSRRPLLT